MVEAALSTRWPESRSTRRSTGSPSSSTCSATRSGAYPVILVAGTNGKTSTAPDDRHVLRAFGLRSAATPVPAPVVGDASGSPSPARPSTSSASSTTTRHRALPRPGRRAPRRTRCRSSRCMTALAYAVFADAPVDVAVVEVGMGGTWDATNVVEPAVAVVTPDRPGPPGLPRARRSRRSPARRPGSSSPSGIARARAAGATRPPRCCSAASPRSGATVAREGARVRAVSPARWPSAGSC